VVLAYLGRDSTVCISRLIGVLKTREVMGIMVIENGEGIKTPF
jgi:hypothetical protein